MSSGETGDTMFDGNVGNGVAVGLGVFVSVAVFVGIGVGVLVSKGLSVGAAMSVGTTVGGTACCGVGVFAGPQAVNARPSTITGITANLEGMEEWLTRNSSRAWD